MTQEACAFPKIVFPEVGCPHPEKKADLHQLEGVARFFDNKGKMLLADDMGLGKTITTLLVLATKEDTFPALIVCPASVMFTWARTAATWLKRLNIDVVVLSDPKSEKKFSSDMNRRALVITSYDRMLTLQRKFLAFKFNSVIFDESHLLLRWESQRTKGAVRTRNAAKYRLCLSGTPMPNGRHREMFGQVQILDEDQWSDLDGYHGYLQRYCDPKPMKLGNKGIVKFDGRSNEAELGRRLRRLILRRTKDQIGGLPEKTRYAINVPLTPAYRLRYTMTEDAVRARFKKKVDETRSELLAAGVLEHRVEAEVKKILSPQIMAITEELRMAVGLMKAEWSIQRVKDLVEEGHPVLVFAFHIEVAETAARLYRKEFGDDAVLIGTGQLSPKLRDDLVQKAQHGNAKVCVLTRAFSAGITLTRFYRGIMLERFWVPGEERQTEDRNYRRGQTKNVAWEYLLMEGTTDDHMGDLQTWKETGESQIHGAREVRLFEYLTR